MLDSDTAALLARILAETKAGRLLWQPDKFDDFYAFLGTNVQPIHIRRKFIEATNQVGADPYFVELSLAGWTGRFPIANDSDGWRAVREILDAAFPNSGWQSTPKRALDQLEVALEQEDRHLSQDDSDIPADNDAELRTRLLTILDKLDVRTRDLPPQLNPEIAALTGELRSLLFAMKTKVEDNLV